MVEQRFYSSHMVLELPRRNAERTAPNVNVVTIEKTSSTLMAIMLAILLVLVSIAGMYFHKHFKVVRREDEEYADMPELEPSDGGCQSDANAENRRCKFVHLDKLEYGRHVTKATSILSNPAESTIGERSACESDYISMSMILAHAPTSSTSTTKSGKWKASGPASTAQEWCSKATLTTLVPERKKMLSKKSSKS